MQEDDILEELTLVDIKELTKMYQLQEKNLPYLYSFLSRCVQAVENEMNDYVKVYSPRSCWREDGTFIASMPIHGHDIVLHSLDPSGKNLLEGLRTTKRFKFARDPARSYTFLFAIHESFHEKILTIVREVYKCDIEFILNLNLWHSTIENGLNLSNVTCPDNVYMKVLNPKDVQVIKKHWPYSYAEADLKLLDYMKLVNGFGIYLKADNQLVSWVAPSCLGQLSALQTLDGHTGKGYSSLLVRQMTKYLAEQGFETCGTVLPGNIAPETILNKLGFQVLCRCTYIAISNNKD